MTLGLGRSALRATVSPVSGLVVIAACAFALAGCVSDGGVNVSATQPRGASVAFDSIDGPPPGQFQMLVRNLNDEAQARRLAVISRADASAYRVRGYLAAKVVQGKTTVSWVWDVFDRDQHRALRIEGEEQSKESKGVRDAWTVADDAMLRRIAHASMDRLAAFLISPDAVPNAAPVTQAAYTVPDQNSPEAAGIFRIFRANADPLPAEAGPAADPVADAGETMAAVPLPPHRPDDSAALAPGEKVTLAASTL